MKRYFYFLFFAAALTAASCVREPMVSTTVPDSPGVGAEDNPYVTKGWLRIRLAQEATPLRVGSFTRGEAESGNPDLDRIAAALGATEIKAVFPTDPRFEERHRKYGLHLWYDVKFDEEVPVSRAQSEFAAVAGVEYVQPHYKILATDGPDYALPSEMNAPTPSYEGNQREMPFNDPGLPLQWHYDNDGSVPNSVAGADIGVFDFWKNVTGGDPSIIVAVMDSSVEYSHEDLAENMWINEAELNGVAGKDDDGNGYKDDIYGYDFHNKTSELVFGSHGTHVAGTVAAVNNNGIGVCGVAGGTGNGDGVKIMTCAMYQPDGEGQYPPAEAYIYAADNGAVISQNSWNYGNPPYGPSTIPEDMSVAFQYFIDNAGTDKDGNQTGPMKGGVIIFAAGNAEQPKVGLPADDPRVICVTAMMPNYKKPIYSNYEDVADIFAPGGAGKKEVEDNKEFGVEARVYSLDLNNSYGYKSGTSMACPHVSGSAALIVAKYGVSNPGFTNQELKTKLLRSYRSVNMYQESERIAVGLGNGLLDLSLLELENPGVAPAAPEAIVVAPDEPTAEKRLTVTVKGIPADANGMGILSIKLAYAKEGTPEGSSEWTEIEEPCRVSAGGSFQRKFAGLEDATTYVFRASVIDRFGNESRVVEGVGRTIDHINLSPVITKPISRIDLPKGGGTEDADFVTTLDLADHFSDPDIEKYGDELSYAVVSNDEQTVKTSITGSVVTIEGVKKGETYITVTVTDLAGESLSKNVSVRVLKDRDNGPVPPPVQEDPVELQEGILNVFPNPAPEELWLGVKGAEGLTVDIEIYDSAARRVVSATGLQLAAAGTQYAGAVKYDVSKLSPGIYTISATLSDGRKFKNSFLKR